MSDEIPIKRYAVYLCDLCVRGEGGSCHSPGCSFCFKRAPDVPMISPIVAEYGYDPMCEPLDEGAAPPADRNAVLELAAKRCNAYADDMYHEGVSAKYYDVADCCAEAIRALKSPPTTQDGGGPRKPGTLSAAQQARVNRIVRDAARDWSLPPDPEEGVSFDVIVREAVELALLEEMAASAGAAPRAAEEERASIVFAGRRLCKLMLEKAQRPAPGIARADYLAAESVLRLFMDSVEKGRLEGAGQVDAFEAAATPSPDEERKPAATPAPPPDGEGE